MKKTYMIPTLQVVKVQSAKILAGSIDMYNQNATGPGMGRGAGFSDSDDWED